MNIRYVNTRIEKLCTNPDMYGYREGLSKKIIEELKILMIKLKSMESCQDFFAPVNKKYNLEKLTNMNGLMSIRLDRKYRVTFYEENRIKNLSFIEITGIEIVEVSNHYGDK